MQSEILGYVISDAIRKLHAKRTADAAALAASFADLKKRMPLAVKRGELHDVFEACRMLYSSMGGILTQDHWQSPAYEASVVNEAGDERGRIVANLNDYKRDQHPVGAVYEKMFALAYLSGLLRKTPTVFATNSGMAALTTAALAVRSRIPEDYRIAVGEHSYFENKELIERMFGKSHISFFEESTPESLKEYSPHAVFFDALANDPELTVPDTKRIFKTLTRMRQRVIAVMDTTCVSALNMPYYRSMNNVPVIAFESLNKFHEFGLDRVTGGVVWAYGIPADELYRARDHAGLGISEASAALLPTPDRRKLGDYLGILSRNASILAEALSAYTEEKRMTVRRPARFGAFVSVQIEGADWRKYRKLLTAIIARAKKMRVPLVAGTSFGLPVTRIYTWVPRSSYEKVFLRISPGLETPEELRRVAGVIAGAL